MQQITYTDSAGRKTVFGPRAPYVLWKVDGLGNPDIQIDRTRAAGQRGQEAHGLRYETREVTIIAHIHGPGGMLYALRRQLNSLMSPEKAPGMLVYENDAGRYVIPCYPEQPRYDDRFREYQTVTLRLLCPDPLWRAEEAAQARLYFGDGSFVFLLMLPAVFGVSAARGVLRNNGDAAAPLEFWVHGGAKRPTIRNRTTGESFTVEKDFPENQTLYIRTGQGEKTVSLLSADGVLLENAFGYLSPDSVLFLLPCGESELEFKNAEEAASTSVSVRFWERYTGV